MRFLLDDLMGFVLFICCFAVIAFICVPRKSDNKHSNCCDAGSPKRMDCRTRQTQSEEDQARADRKFEHACKQWLTSDGHSGLDK